MQGWEGLGNGSSAPRRGWLDIPVGVVKMLPPLLESCLQLQGTEQLLILTALNLSRLLVVAALDTSAIL